MINALTPDKISELKYIFQICDPQNNGEFPFSELPRGKRPFVYWFKWIWLVVLEDLKTAGSKEDILAIFDSVKDEQTNRVSKQQFGKLLSQLERVCDKL